MSEQLELLRGITISDQCWQWAGAVNACGYGHTFNGAAHRRMYAAFVGPIPDGMSVCHTCDNPACVNPFHLFLGTHSDNMADMARKGRAGRRAGEDSPTAKLNTAAVLFILSSPLQAKELGAMFGVTSTRVRQIRRGIGWRAVQRQITAVSAEAVQL